MNVACIRLLNFRRQKRKQRNLLPIEQLFHSRITDGNHTAEGCTNYRLQRNSVIRTGQVSLEVAQRPPCLEDCNRTAGSARGIF